ncbi:MAG: hypothetical protein JRN20_17650 [Nitrososphaerota archaeon]|nr:hypothetical protein [Nitrososphaerota archaeon]MDG6923581.1 hypothetical protein [Nitrososphaerota archaeon]
MPTSKSHLKDVKTEVILNEELRRGMDVEEDPKTGQLKLGQRFGQV